MRNDQYFDSTRRDGHYSDAMRDFKFRTFLKLQGVRLCVCVKWGSEVKNLKFFFFFLEEHFIPVILAPRALPNSY